jgi:hypothetical protein
MFFKSAIFSSFFAKTVGICILYNIVGLKMSNVCSPLPNVTKMDPVPYFSAILQPTIFKFWILREDYLSTRSSAVFVDPKPRSSGIELRLEPSQIKVFSLYFVNF